MNLEDNSKNDIASAINEEIWSIYNSNTQTLSNICRQIAFAEGGICWFYKLPLYPLPSNVVLILKFLVWFFLLDALQYFIAVTLYWLVAKHYECRNKQKLLKKPSEVVRTWWMNRPSSVLFLAKIICLTFSSYYVILLLTKS
jgi:hypothetical protein